MSEQTEALRRQIERLEEEIAQRSGAEEALQRERNLLRALMDHLPHNIYFKDADSRFTRINRSMAEHFGLSDPDEAVGKTDFDFFSEEHARQAREDEQQLLHAGRLEVDKEEKETWPDGHVTWVATTKLPLYDEEGRIAGTFGISRNVTEQKQAEEGLRTSEMKFRTLFDSSRDAIMVVGPDDRFTSGNPAAIELFGCEDEQQFTSCTPADLSPEYQPDGMPSLEKARQMIATAKEAGSHFFEWKHKRIDGTEFFATVLLTSTELEGQRVVQATVRDVTREKQAAEALRAAKEAAEAASRAKSVFLANVSHEIRTPMNAVLGMTELLLDGPVSPQQEEYLTVVRESGEALLSVINDILDFSKIEAGKLALERVVFDLAESLGDTMKSLAVRAHGQGLELAFHIHGDVPNVLVGDCARLRQVVVNLVGNAIKFTESGEVVLEVRREELLEEDVVLHFTVRDTGIGIPPEKLSAIFEMFEQVDSATTRRYGGTGLGLAIASRLVELMGGRVWVESQFGRGSTFHFTVQFRRTDEEPLETRPERPVVIRDMRVLVVDDNATNRHILEEIVSNWQMRPASASGAREALDLLRRAREAGEPYSLVLTDAHMPEMDGFALAEQIKDDGELGSTAIMMLTSGSHPGDVARCERLGIAAYLLKPVKQPELFDAVMLAMGIATPEDRHLAADEQPGRLGPLRILLAEDSLVNQKLVVALLEKYGHTVVVAANGREAMAALQRQQFDLVLMDVQMPEMDGLKTTKAIRTKEQHTGKHVPIIAMTAHALKGDRERCLEAGMDEYVAKPIYAGQLFETMERVLGTATPRSPEPAAAESAEESFDFSEALQAVRGDRRLLRIVAEAALEEIPRRMTEIRRAIADRDAAALKLSAHAVKGSIRYFGLKRAFDAAFELEKMGQGDTLEDTDAALATLDAETARLLPALGDLLRASDASRSS